MQGQGRDRGGGHQVDLASRKPGDPNRSTLEPGTKLPAGHKRYQQDLGGLLYTRHTVISPNCVVAPHTVRIHKIFLGVQLGLDHGIGHPSNSCPRWKQLTH